MISTACGSSTETAAPTPPPAPAAPTPATPSTPTPTPTPTPAAASAFTGAREDFPPAWTSLPDEATDAAAEIARVSELAHVTVRSYAYPHFTTNASDPMAELAVPVWTVGSAEDASTLADALVAADREGYPSSGAFMVLPTGVLRIGQSRVAELTAHLASRGVTVARVIWPFVTAEPGTFPASWVAGTDEEDRSLPEDESARFGAPVQLVAVRHFTGPGVPFTATYYTFANLDAAWAAGTTLLSSLEEGQAVRVGPSTAVVLPEAHVEELASLYREHGLELVLASPTLDTDETDEGEEEAEGE
ncbi:MAG: hypothetical protein U0353_07190 [Sandaracinus sp.]